MDYWICMEDHLVQNVFRCWICEVVHSASNKVVFVQGTNCSPMHGDVNKRWLVFLVQELNSERSFQAKFFGVEGEQGGTCFDPRATLLLTTENVVILQFRYNLCDQNKSYSYLLDPNNSNHTDITVTAKKCDQHIVSTCTTITATIFTLSKKKTLLALLTLGDHKFE